MDQAAQVCSKDFGNERKQVYNGLEQIMLETVPAQLIIGKALLIALLDLLFSLSPS